MKKKISVVYVAGPFRNKTKLGVRRNIDRAESISHRLWLYGYATISPHMNSGFMENSKGLGNVDMIKAYLDVVSRCDAVILVEGWEKSEGSLLEIDKAIEIGIPVYKTLQEFLQKNKEGPYARTK
jgi:hypothetical protein